MKTNTLLTALGLTIALAQVAPSISLLPSVQAALSRSAIATTTQNTPWRSILGTVTAPTQWTVKSCDGKAPFLCATANQKRLGHVERQPFEPDLTRTVAGFRFGV